MNLPKKPKSSNPRQSEAANRVWVDKYGAAALLDVSPHTIRTYRSRYWQSGIHYQKLNTRTIRYHQELLEDWFANRSCPQSHQRAIEAYLASLLSNQIKKRGRSSKSNRPKP